MCGSEAARPLQEAARSEPSMDGQVVVLNDDLQTGPLLRAEGQSFQSLRREWWQMITPAAEPSQAPEDINRILELSNALNRNEAEEIWLWMAPCATDICAYSWALSLLCKHAEKLRVLNLANLPFLDENGKVFYPENISQILPRELIKARRLACPITPSEADMECDSWARLTEENALLRIMREGRKLKSESESFYDAALLNCLSPKAQKAPRILTQARTKAKIPAGEAFLAWRLRNLASQGSIRPAGDLDRPYKEWEFSLPAAEESAATADAGTMDVSEPTA